MRAVAKAVREPRETRVMRDMIIRSFAPMGKRTFTVVSFLSDIIVFSSVSR
jgi:hypothetical protein